MEHNIKGEIINKICFQRRHASYNIFLLELFIYFQEREYDVTNKLLNECLSPSVADIITKAFEPVDVDIPKAHPLKAYQRLNLRG